jgi:glycosyltransferase involved in cell wall biosynthesis
MIVFVTVFVSPHILPLCEELHELTGGGFAVIEKKRPTKEREKLGYGAKGELPLVVNYRENKKLCIKMLLKADVVIYAGVPCMTINRRIMKNKLTFFASERLLRRGILKFFHYKLWKQIFSNLLSRGRNTHLLCLGLFAGRDFASLGFDKSKMWKFGYFPKLHEYEADELIAAKQSPVIRILWVGRLICLKKPLELLKAAALLSQAVARTAFHVDMAGCGKKHLEKRIKRFVKRNGLKNIVTLHGLKNNDGVIEMMKKADIFVSTSSKREGWGAVVNEAMNNACTVIASDNTGCASYLIEYGENGLVYKSGNYHELYFILERLIKNKEEMKRLGKNAYCTIRDTWNAKIAAKRLMQLIEDIQICREPSFKEGPCSRENLCMHPQPGSS